MERPDLSFLTKENFENFEDYCTWSIAKIKGEEYEKYKRIAQKLPQLISIAEMFFDAQQSSPEGTAFNFVKNTLDFIENG